MSTGRIAFIGDINGAPGRMVLEQQLPMLRERFGPLRIVANAENARNGSGLTPDLYETFRRFGIDAMTLGDHVYRDARIVPILEDPSKPISRPANLSVRAQGKRMIRVPATPEFPRDLYIFTLLGRVHMPSLLANDPFACADEMLQSVPERNPVVLVEAHMEATSEKGALARYLDGRVAAVLGTHTHVATADARVLRGGTAFMTDVGMTGPHDSVIGRKPEQVLRHFVSGMHVPFEMGSGGEAIQGAVVEVSLETGLAVSIERIDFPADYSRAPFRTMHSR
ncbi:MAG: YmdB family metallophosphoesterase [Phycisphaerales bacterium]|nr:YmdB family metallophosphoesterase [Phycisphaerales bacterium]